MKVISGLLKGREIIGFKNPGTRPTMDRVKESLFAIIQNDINDKIILDLFSGSGNLAIEAISEGARFAWCNDQNREAFKIINKNIDKLAIKDQVEALNFDFKKALKYLAEKEIAFDLIFLDPPYQTDYIKTSIEQIEKYNLLKEQGKIICETDSLDKIPESDHLEVVKTKKYGDKFVAILKKI